MPRISRTAALAASSGARARARIGRGGVEGWATSSPRHGATSSTPMSHWADPRNPDRRPWGDRPVWPGRSTGVAEEPQCRVSFRRPVTRGVGQLPVHSTDRWALETQRLGHVVGGLCLASEENGTGILSNTQRLYSQPPTRSLSRGCSQLLRLSICKYVKACKCLPCVCVLSEKGTCPPQSPEGMCTSSSKVLNGGSQGGAQNIHSLRDLGTEHHPFVAPGV